MNTRRPNKGMNLTRSAPATGTAALAGYPRCSTHVTRCLGEECVHSSLSSLVWLRSRVLKWRGRRWKAASWPAALSSQLGRTFPGWKVLQRDDLPPDDLSLYVQDHPQGCPGQVAVDFVGDAFPAMALSLKKPGQARLVLARQRTPRVWELEVVDESNESGVVWTEGPGQYDDVHEDRRLRVAREGVIWCGYESWTILYAWIDGKIQKVWIAD
jgi:hypothetical protein